MDNNDKAKTNIYVDKINEITKIYYLVYDYEHLNEKSFEQAKNEAILLWKK